MSNRTERRLFAALLAGAVPIGAMTSPARAAGPDAPIVVAQAATQAPANDAAAKPADAPPATWVSGITFGAQFDTGFVGNPASPQDRINFGQTFNDRANQPMLNQSLFTVQRLISPDKPGDYEIGFKLQGMYGSDARYAQVMGIFNHAINNQIQPALTEANMSIHLPFISDGGVDVKAGLYPTPLGVETIDPSTNAFYTKSYIFNFGLPLEHTGAYATAHVTPMVDIYGGMDTGANTTFGNGGDNNSALAGLLGFGLTLMDGNLKFLVLSHFGPENPSRTVPDANHYYRYFNDGIITYKVNDKVLLTTELNWVHEALGSANGYGGAQYIAYNLTDTITLNARGEVWRDDKGFFVAAFPQVHGFVNSQLGLPATIIGAPPTTYGAITLGLTYKPALSLPPLAGLMLRPEIRYNSSLNGTKPYNGGKDTGSFLMSADAVINF